MYFRKEIGQSLTLKFAESAAKRREQGLPIISLGLGEPDFDTPAEIIEATIAVLKNGNSGYSSPLGLMTFREQIAQKLRDENSIPAKAGQIIVAAGAKQALQTTLMAMLEPGDEVIVVEPSFVSFIPQIYLAEPTCVVHTVDVDPGSFELSLSAIEEKFSSNTKAILINSPNNPAGYVLKESQLRSLYKIVEQHDAYIISDEIYEKLTFEGVSHFSIGSLESSVERVVTINGYSKSHAMTGWRLGYACYPDKLNSKILKIQQHMNTNCCTFIQGAMASLDGKIDMSFLHNYCATLMRRKDMVVQTIADNKMLEMVSPLSGFFAFINISRTGLSSNEFCSLLMESTGVAITPGIAFGENWDDHVRLSYATKDDTLSAGLAGVQEFAQSINK